MAWSGGTELFEDVITAAQKKASPTMTCAVIFYLELIEAFEREGWDEQADCRGLDAAFDEALESLHPELTEDEDDEDDSDDDVYH